MARKRKRMRRNASAKKWIEKDWTDSYEGVEKSEREVHGKW